MRILSLSRQRRRLVVLASVTALAATAGTMIVQPGHAETRQERRPTERELLMDRKLDHAQRILGGLAEAEFEPIAQSARALKDLSQKAAWRSLPTADYRRYSDEFRRLTDQLAHRAEAHDLDGATLAYVQLTINCVECHKYVRIRMKPPPLPAPDGR